MWLHWFISYTNKPQAGLIMTHEPIPLVVLVLDTPDVLGEPGELDEPDELEIGALGALFTSTGTA